MQSLTLYPQIVSAETILFWIWPYVLWPLVTVTVHKSAETIQGRKLFAEIRYSSLSWLFLHLTTQVYVAQAETGNSRWAMTTPYELIYVDYAWFAITTFDVWLSNKFTNSLLFRFREDWSALGGTVNSAILLKYPTFEVSSGLFVLSTKI